MNLTTEELAQSSDFLHKSSLGVALVGLVILTPFAVNNFVQGRNLLGVGALAIVLICAFNAWSIISLNRYYSLLTLLVLVPAILFFLFYSIRYQGIVGILWCYPALLSFYFMLTEKKAWIANIALFAVIFPGMWNVIENPLAIRVMMTLFGVSVFSAIFVRVITEQQKKLQNLAVMDSLTGLLNRMLLNETLKQAIQQNNRTGVPMTLVALDLDHFKKINDTLGHDAGDTVLRGVGKLLQKRCRSVDRAFRLGGEEFLVLLYGTDAENGKQFAEELRNTIESHSFLSEKTITVSIGVATLTNGENWKKWMKRSDEKLYSAKLDGRNRVAV